LNALTTLPHLRGLLTTTLKLPHHLEDLLHHLRVHASQAIHRIVRDDLATAIGPHLKRFRAIFTDRVLATWSNRSAELPAIFTCDGIADGTCSIMQHAANASCAVPDHATPTKS
jgi:hypothetical protein